jgi:hypothetical protein
VNAEKPKQNKLSMVLSLFNQGQQAYRDSKGNKPSMPQNSRYDSSPTNAVAASAYSGVGSDLGGAAGGIVDQLVNVVVRHPLAFGAAGLALVLYFIQPRGGGYSRR